MNISVKRFKESTSKQIKLILKGNESRRENAEEAEEHKCDRNKFSLNEERKQIGNSQSVLKIDTTKQVLYIIYLTETPDLIN